MACARSVLMPSITEIEKAWRSRCEAQGYSEKEIISRQADFFAGAMAVMNEVPLGWFTKIMRGEPI